MSLPGAPPVPGLRPRQAAGLLLIPAAERTRDQERAWRQVHQIHPAVDRTLSMLQQLLALIHARSREGLDAWLDRR